MDIVKTLALDFAALGIKNPTDAARKFIQGYTPEITAFKRTDNEFLLKIKNWQGSSLVSCIINGDKGWQFYTGKNGIAHAASRFGDCGTGVSEWLPASYIKRITEIEFISPVYNGETVWISIKKDSDRGRYTFSTITGWVVYVGFKIPIFKPSKLATVLKPKK